MSKRKQALGRGLFYQDTFSLRRASQPGAGVPYDPESLLSGKEAAEGMTYENSHREWPNEESYEAATRGQLTTDEVLAFHPRVKNERLVTWGMMMNPFGDDYVIPSN